jgi:hypothetical protein
MAAGPAWQHGWCDTRPAGTVVDKNTELAWQRGLRGSGVGVATWPRDTQLARHHGRRGSRIGAAAKSLSHWIICLFMSMSLKRKPANRAVQGPLPKVPRSRALASGAWISLKQIVNVYCQLPKNGRKRLKKSFWWDLLPKPLILHTNMLYRPTSGFELSYGITQGVYYTQDPI